MNNKGQTIAMSILFAVFLFIFGMLFLNFLRPLIIDVRNADNLDCQDVASISDGIKVTCLLTDGVIPYFIVTIISLAGGILTSKLLI